MHTDLLVDKFALVLNTRWNSRKKNTSYELLAASLNIRKWVQLYKLRAQIHEFWVLISKLGIQIHELRVQIHEF